MSKIVCTFTPSKSPREQSISSDSSVSSPEHKRQVISSPSEIDKLLIYHSETNVNMANVKVDIDETAPVWSKQMYDMICKVNEKIDEMGVSQNMLEEKANKATETAENAQRQVTELKTQVDSAIKENAMLKNKLTDFESYSKKYNLKVYNVPEHPNEGPDMLLAKIADLFIVMDLDIRKMYIDNIHRLPSLGGRGVRPIIINFVSLLDRDKVWSRRASLASITGPSVWIREHYAREVEENIRKLLPIRKAALQQKMSVRMTEDKLVITVKHSQ